MAEGASGGELSREQPRIDAGTHRSTMTSATPASASSTDYWKDRPRLPSGVGPALLTRLSALVCCEPHRGQFAVPAPFTGERLGDLPRCTVADVALAAGRARGAQPEWASTSVHARMKVLLRFHDLLLARQEQALDLIQLESGKARRHALEEVLDTSLVARYYGLHAAAHLRPRRRAAGLPFVTTAWEVRHPVGLVGVVAPWNFPLILGITDLLAALAAGNAVVLRPDEQSSFTALWAVALLQEAGLPLEVLQVVTGEGPLLGPALVDAVDFMMFTGSTRTGRTVARQAADRLIGYSLELGGKNPMVVLDDADVERATEGLIRGAFAGAGQVCVSIERVFLPRAMFEHFADRLVARVRAMRISPALAYDVEMGSMTVARQVEVVERQVADALAKGATLLAGGRRRPDLGPLFYEPTVLANVAADMELFAQETFGPVVALYAYDDLDEAIARANDTPYGLNASVWSRSTRRAMAVARRIRAGTVNVNESYAGTWTATDSPIGGMKQSGAGRRHGAEGILKYTDAQTIAVQRFIPLAPPPFVDETLYARWFPRVVGLMRYIPGLR
jgi:succinate-semialdehyde dehydrogenase / glutarate-semialdehyde dehydrogenase